MALEYNLLLIKGEKHGKTLIMTLLIANKNF